MYHYKKKNYVDESQRTKHRGSWSSEDYQDFFHQQYHTATLNYQKCFDVSKINCRQNQKLFHFQPVIQLYIACQGKIGYINILVYHNPKILQFLVRMRVLIGNFSCNVLQQMVGRDRRQGMYQEK